MSLFRIRESEETKRNNLAKVVVLKQALSAGYQTLSASNNVKLRNTADSSKQGDTARSATKFPELAPPRFAATTTGLSQMGDGKLPMWHYLMEQTFETFLLRLDDIFLSLRRDAPKNGTCTDIPGYQDICEKLRTEILIAMDRLELLTMPKDEVSETKAAFLNKLNGLKRQLSDLRWQYHNTIKDLGAKMI